MTKKPPEEEAEPFELLSHVQCRLCSEPALLRCMGCESLLCLDCVHDQTAHYAALSEHGVLCLVQLYAWARLETKKKGGKK